MSSANRDPVERRPLCEGSGLTNSSKGTKFCPRPSKEGMRGKAVIVAVSVWMGVAGCSSGEGPGDGASCALVVDFEGRTYEGHGVQVAPEEGSPLGTAVLPACNDTEGAEESPEGIEVARLPGVPPRDAILWRGRTDTVLLRTGLPGYSGGDRSTRTSSTVRSGARPHHTEGALARDSRRRREDGTRSSSSVRSQSVRRGIIGASLRSCLPGHPGAFRSWEAPDSRRHQKVAVGGRLDRGGCRWLRRTSFPG
jgi:hypothetical protein